MKVVCGYDPGALRRKFFAAWEDEGVSVFVSPESGDEDKFKGDLQEAEVLLHILKPVTKEVFSAAPRLRLVQKIGVGVNTIDLEAAKSHGVAVANMPGTNTQAVAEATLMLMLSALRNLTGFDRACRSGNGWAPEGVSRERRYTLGELRGRTVGLVGGGAVASRLVRPLRGLSIVGCCWRIQTDVHAASFAKAETRLLGGVNPSSHSVTRRMLSATAVSTCSRLTFSWPL